MKRLLAIILILCILLVGCGSNPDFKSIEENDTSSVMIYVDPQTGVNYLVYTVAYRGGMTVRYNADGSIMVTKEIKEEER